MWAARIGKVLGPIAALAVLAVYEGPQGKIGALLLWAMIWWMTEAVPMAVTALLAACGAVLLGLTDAKSAFSSFASPPLFLFVGSFFIAEALQVHGLGERMAHALISRAHSPTRLLVMTGVVSFLLSAVVSNAASTAIVLPVALSAALHVGSSRFTTGLVLAVAWSASVGGLVTPVGTPPNLIGMATLQQHGSPMSFLGWIATVAPMAVVMLVGLLGLLSLRFGVGRDAVNHPAKMEANVEAVASQARPNSPLQPGEWAVLVALALALIGWLLPSVAELLAPTADVTRWLKRNLQEDVVAVLAACTLFLSPGGRRGAAWSRPALLWSEATRIEWGIILLFGGGMLLGQLSDKTGLSREIGLFLAEWTGASSTVGITMLVTAVAIAMSELTSNTATATLMAPLSWQLAVAAGASPVPAVLGATIGASFGFMMPVSTAPNALAYGTGRVPMAEMIKTGILFDLLGYVLILAGLAVVSLWLG